MIIVVRLRGCMDMRIEPVELVSLYIEFAPNIRVWYAWFVREVLGWFGLRYICTIQSYDIYSPPDLYECILL